MIVSLGTMTAVSPYVFCSLAPGLIALRADGAKPRITVIEIVAFLFSIFTVYGCGPEPVLYGLVLLLLGPGLEYAKKFGASSSAVLIQKHAV